MTTYRSKPREIASHSIRTLRFSPVDEDLITFETWDGEDGPQLFEISFTKTGQRSVVIGGEDVSIDLGTFQELLRQGIETLERWDADLRTDGAPWSDSPMWEREQ